MPSRKGFTLIELLVVIAIIAILAVVVVLTLNPANLLAQSRDANRISDMATLNTALNFYITDSGGTGSLGAASTSYLSIPSSAGNCSTLGLASSAYAYACSTPANYRFASSTGWIPVAFNNISAGSPISVLPVDPMNQTSTNLYYRYEEGSSTYALSTFFESQKYAKNMENSPGIDPGLYQIGSGVASLPSAASGLAGYWSLNEGAGSSTLDWSGYGNNGTWSGTPAGTSGWYTPGHIWQWGGAFDGSSTLVTTPANATALGPTNAVTMTAWVYPISPGNPAFIGGRGTTGLAGYWLAISGASYDWDVGNGTVNLQQVFGSVSTGAWQFVAGTYDGTNQIAYLNGAQIKANTTVTGAINYTGASTFYIGNITGLTSNRTWSGYINDVRVYDRALSAAEIQELYNSEK